MRVLPARKSPIAALMFCVFFLLASSSSAQETVLYTFTGGADGGGPVGGLISDTAGNLYGATYLGGAFSQGTVFMVTPSGVETVLHSFGAFAGDGESPNGVVFDGVGNLYGTTTNGGAFNAGTVFELSPGTGGTWTEQILYSFCSIGYPQDCNDGANPYNGVTLDGQGDIFGTTTFGGGSQDDGVVFELVPDGSAGYTEVLIHDFTGGTDGSSPGSDVSLDGTGNLYGEVGSGGSSLGLGLVYKLTPQSGSWTYTVLLDFNGLNGSSPEIDSVILDSSGNIYATTGSGGICASPPGGCGVVFELSPNTNGGYDQTRLYRFAGGLDGDAPNTGLSLDSSGDVYGSTARGGGAGCGLGLGCGTIFELSPVTAHTWTETILNSFNNSNGAKPAGGVTFAPGTAGQSVKPPGKRGCPGGCYGGANLGGKYNQGVIFYLPQ